MTKKHDVDHERRRILPASPGPFGGHVCATAVESTPQFPTPLRPPKGAPNVIFFMLDDVGFGQTATFGGPIETPTLDRIAAAGLKYTSFHTTAMCSPTRAALLTGRNHHAVGYGCIVEWATGFPGYNCIFPRSSATIAEILRGNGYGTAAVGKWHNTPDWETGPTGPFERWPTSLGFEYFYGFIGADCDQFVPPLIENTVPIEPPRRPGDGYVLDADLAEQAISWIRRQRAFAPDRPFFLWYTPGTAHSPLHAPKDWIARYESRFEHGWDRQRELTLARQKEIGVVPADTRLTARPDEIPAWADLSPDRRRLATRYQEAFAGAVSHCDHQIGRVIDALEDLGQLRNSLIIFVVGDNGPSAEGGLGGAFNKFSNINGIPEDEKAILAKIDEIGGPGSYSNYPVGWAWAGSSPLQWFKQIASHLGGIRNGMVVSWPEGGAAGGEVRTQFHHCVDVAPTILEATHIPKPDVVNGFPQAAFDGVSFAYTFEQRDAPTRHRRQYFEMIGNRSIYEEGWIASARHGPLPWQYSGGKRGSFDEDQWELYHLDTDFSQAVDLASREPQRLRELQRLWSEEAARYGVFPLDDRRAQRMALESRPIPGGGRNSFDYFPGCIRIPESLAPNVKGRSHRIRCAVDYRPGDEGVLVAAGGRFGGYVLMIKDGCIRYTHNLCGIQSYDVVSRPLAPGAQVLAFEFEVDEPTLGAGGVARLLSGTTEIGRGRIDRTVPFRYSWGDTFNVGRDTGTPVTDDYVPPFHYTGLLKKVTIDILSNLGAPELRNEVETAERLAQHNE